VTTDCILLSELLLLLLAPGTALFIDLLLLVNHLLPPALLAQALLHHHPRDGLRLTALEGLLVKSSNRTGIELQADLGLHLLLALLVALQFLLEQLGLHALVELANADVRVVEQVAGIGETANHLASVHGLVEPSSEAVSVEYIAP
jgi:hypothetical protein